MGEDFFMHRGKQMRIFIHNAKEFLVFEVRFIFVRRSDWEGFERFIQCKKDMAFYFYNWGLRLVKR